MNNPGIIAELRRIADANGGELKPSEVVAAARLKSSPLHSQFDWEDSDAAHKWRLHQARNLIRVTVEYIGAGEDAVTTRVFVSLTPDRQEGGGGYRTMGAVMSNKQHREQLLADAIAEMRVFEKKYSDLKELAVVFAAMRKVRRDKAA